MLVFLAEPGLITGTVTGSLRGYSLKTHAELCKYEGGHESRVSMITSSLGRLHLDHTDFGVVARANAHVLSIDTDFNAKLWDASLQPITGLQWNDLGYGPLLVCGGPVLLLCA
jgi:hypothetical protein